MWIVQLPSNIWVAPHNIFFIIKGVQYITFTTKTLWQLITYIRSPQPEVDANNIMPRYHFHDVLPYTLYLTILLKVTAKQ